MTKEEAIAKVQTGWWKTATPEEIVRFQLYEDRLCMDFGDFHGAVEKALGRPVFTHEFAYPASLRAELEKRIPQATFTDVLAKIPPDKKVIVVETP